MAITVCQNHSYSFPTSKSGGLLPCVGCGEVLIECHTDPQTHTMLEMVPVAQCSCGLRNSPGLPRTPMSENIADVTAWDVISFTLIFIIDPMVCCLTK